MSYANTRIHQARWTRTSQAAAFVFGGLLLCSLCAACPARADQQAAAQPDAVRRQLNQPQTPPPTAKLPPAPAQPTHPKNQSAAVQKSVKPTTTAALVKKPDVQPKTALAVPPKPGNPKATNQVSEKSERGAAVAAASDAAPKYAETSTVPRRDPFAPLLNNTTAKGDAIPVKLPPGKGGLVIATLHVDGIVSGPNGMIAIVSNPQERVYFLREGDRLYDGQVVHIALDTVAFHETGKDPFGNPVEREVSKALINTSLGEAP